MYEAYDPRSKLASQQAGAAPAPAGFAAAEYVKFHELAPTETTAHARTWYGRGQNMVVSYSEVESGAQFARSGQVDEYMLVIPEAGAGAVIEAGSERAEVPGFSLAIVPPGDSKVTMRQKGLLIRVISTRNADVAALSSNAAAYNHQHPNIPPFQDWPAPPGGYRIRHYSLDVPAKPGRFGRIFRCTTMMINMLPFEPAPRDTAKLSPHHHDDFEQCSLAIQGAFTHHIRWPWVANQQYWRNDDHEDCPAPSIAIIPPPAIHTSAATRTDGNQLVDIFSPPRFDFSKQDGWVLNADEYPMPGPKTGHESMSVEMIDPPVVDSHAHIFTPDMPVADSAWMKPDYGFTAADYLKVLDAHGVHFGVIAGISIFGSYNDYMIDELRRQPRLRGTVNIDPGTDRYTLERMKADGVVGVRLQLSRRRELPDLGSETYRLLLRRVADLNWHVHLALEGKLLPAVLPALEASGVRVVLDHFGHPDQEEGIENAGFQALLRSVDKGRTWVKLSAGYRLTWLGQHKGAPDPRAMALAQQAAARLLQVAGPERLLWGSDCPFVGHESSLTFADTLRSFQEWVPSAAARRKISDTALRLYFS